MINNYTTHHYRQLSVLNFRVFKLMWSLYKMATTEVGNTAKILGHFPTLIN